MSLGRITLLVKVLVAGLFMSSGLAHAQPVLARENLNDLTGSVTTNAAIQRVVDLGIMTAVSPGTFAPASPITRRQFVIAVQRLFNLSSRGFVQSFHDIASVDPDFRSIAAVAPYLTRTWQMFCPGCALNNNLRPEQPMSAVEQSSLLTSVLVDKRKLTFVNIRSVTKILASAPGVAQMPAPARRLLATAVQNNIMSIKSLNAVRANRPPTRAEAAIELDSVRSRFKLMSEVSVKN